MFSVTDHFDLSALETAIRGMLAAARGCVVEIVFKDTQTFQGQPERLVQAVELASRISAEGYT